MARAALSVIAGLVTWAVVVTLLNLGLRAALPGYHAAEATLQFTLTMKIGRLTEAALASLAAGAVAGFIALERKWAPWAVGLITLALFLPSHVMLWNKFPVWYHLSFLVPLVPLVLLGAAVARRAGRVEGKRLPIVRQPGEGRPYSMGQMRAVFKADLDETAGRYSVSEWWLEPNTRGPNEHQHPEDHVYYVLDGNLNLCLNGDWSEVPRGTCIVIPGGTPHTFENRGGLRTGFLTINSPGGFEARMKGIEADMAAKDLRIA